jgi:hypothetical protein
MRWWLREMARTRVAGPWVFRPHAPRRHALAGQRSHIGKVSLRQSQSEAASPVLADAWPRWTMGRARPEVTLAPEEDDYDDDRHGSV